MYSIYAFKQVNQFGGKKRDESLVNRIYLSYSAKSKMSMPIYYAKIYVPMLHTNLAKCVFVLRQGKSKSELSQAKYTRPSIRRVE